MASAYVFANNAQTTIPGAITNVATSITVQSGTAFSAPGTGQQFMARIDNTGTPGSTVYEYVAVTANAANVLTVVRAQEGTSGFAFAAGATITQVVTAATVQGAFPTKLAQTATSGASFTLASGIVQTFSHLQIIFQAAANVTTNGAVSLQFNGDTAANYDVSWIETNGAGSPLVTGSNAAAATSMRVSYSTTTGSGSSATIFIPNYSSVSLRKTLSSTQTRVDGDAVNTLFSTQYNGQWRSVAAITSIVVLTSAGTFGAGTASLYGLP